MSGVTQWLQDISPSIFNFTNELLPTVLAGNVLPLWVWICLFLPLAVIIIFTTIKVILLL